MALAVGVGVSGVSSSSSSSPSPLAALLSQLPAPIHRKSVKSNFQTPNQTKKAFWEDDNDSNSDSTSSSSSSTMELMNIDSDITSGSGSISSTSESRALVRPSEAAERALAESTLNQLRRSAKSARGGSGAGVSLPDPTRKYVRYIPNESAQSTSGGQHNSGASERIISIQAAQVDPLEPSKHRAKKLPTVGDVSGVVPVLHSDQSKRLTVEEQQAWRIPPAISNWKNRSGHTIPLHLRIAADGRNLREHSINENHAALAESLYVAERMARQEIEEKVNATKRQQQEKKEKRDDDLRQLAQRTRQAQKVEQINSSDNTLQEYDDGVQKNVLDQEKDDGKENNKRKHDEFSLEDRAVKDEIDRDEWDSQSAEDRERREDIRRKRERAIQREVRQEAKREKWAARDEMRDISERIALGKNSIQTNGDAGQSGFDEQLFHHANTSNSNSAAGFGHEDAYNLYDQPLFRGSAASATALHRPRAQDFDDDDGRKSSDSVTANTHQTQFSAAEQRSSSLLEQLERQHDTAHSAAAPIQFEPARANSLQSLSDTQRQPENESAAPRDRQREPDSGRAGHRGRERERDRERHKDEDNAKDKDKNRYSASVSDRDSYRERERLRERAKEKESDARADSHRHRSGEHRHSSRRSRSRSP